MNAHSPIFELRKMGRLTVATVTYSDGSMFTTSDWQSAQPQTVDEIPLFSWSLVNPNDPEDTSQWTPAIIMGGYPRTMR